MGENLSYEAACERAYIMHRQGISYPKIAVHLKKVGYVSAKTKEPVSHLTARLMAKAYEREEAEELREERLEEAKAKSNGTMRVYSPVQDIVRAVEKILDLDGIPDAVKIKLTRELIENSRPKAQSAQPTGKKRGRPPGKAPAKRKRRLV